MLFNNFYQYWRCILLISTWLVMSRKQSAWFLNRNRDLEKCQFHVRSLSLSYFEFVRCFKYLGHMITDTLDDDLDIQCEFRNLFTRTNILARRFGKCSTHVKITLFKAYCVCMMPVCGRSIAEACLANSCNVWHLWFDMYSVLSTQRAIQITVSQYSTVVLTVVRVMIAKYRKSGIWGYRSSLTPELVELKYCMSDYVAHRTQHAPRGN